MIQHGKEHYCLINDTYAKQFIETTYFQISKEILHKKNIKLGLYSGSLGDLLFCKYYSDIFVKEMNSYDIIENIVFNEIFKVINKNKTLLIVQFGLTLQIMQNEFFSSTHNEQLLKSIDIVLEEYFHKISKNNNYDFFSGCTTFALYFYLRKNESLQNLFLTRIEHDFYSNRFNIDENLALAHGWVNALLLSMKIIKQNNRLKEKFHNFLIDLLKMAQMQVCVQNEIIELNTNSGLAWCNGSLPICLALEKSLQVMPNSSFYIEGRKLSQKKIVDSINSTQPKDACLCHGSSGIAMLFCQFAEFDDYKGFAEDAIEHWLKIMFSQLETSKSKNLSFYKNYSGLLLGKSGVGLFLISLINPTKRKWLELLLLE